MQTSHIQALWSSPSPPGKLLPEHRIHYALRRDRNCHLRLHCGRRDLFLGPGDLTSTTLGELSSTLGELSSTLFILERQGKEHLFHVLSFLFLPQADVIYKMSMTDRWEKWVNRRVHECVNKGTHLWMSACLDEWESEWVHEKVHEWILICCMHTYSGTHPFMMSCTHQLPCILVRILQSRVPVISLVNLSRNGANCAKLCQSHAWRLQGHT